MASFGCVSVLGEGSAYHGDVYCTAFCSSVILTVVIKTQVKVWE